MRISFVINEPIQDASGGYKMVYLYANEFAERGHQVTIYYLCRREKLFSNYSLPFIMKFEVAKVLARRGPRWFEIDKRVTRVAIKAISDSNIYDGDIVIATAVNTAKPVYELDKSKGRKVYFIQGFENWDCSDSVVYDTYSLGMTNIVVANWLKKIVDMHSISPAYVVSNCIDKNVFYDRGYDRINHSIVFQYREAGIKGPQYALDAINRLALIYPDLYVSIISVDEPPQDLPKCCKFYKSITPDEVARINNLSEVFICTSIEEGYGLPGLEAMACGCVVCSSAYKGVFEYANDGIDSLLSPIMDVDKMIDNVRLIFDHSDTRRRIANAALKNSNEKSIKKMGALFETILIGKM